MAVDDALEDALADWSTRVKDVKSLTETRRAFRAGWLAAMKARNGHAPPRQEKPMPAEKKSAVARKGSARAGGEEVTSNKGRILAHLLAAGGEWVQAADLHQHIHTKPKKSTIQANIASYVAALRRLDGFDVEAKDGAYRLRLGRRP